MKRINKMITIGPFHIFKLRAIHKKEIGVADWRNRYANLDGPSDGEEEKED